MNNLDKIYNNNNDIKSFYVGYINYLKEILDSVSLEEIEVFFKALISARNLGKQIFFIGNGGSASTSSHFANDLSIGAKSHEKPFRAISLCDNVAVISAIANDYGYEKIFSEQLRVLMNHGDLVVAISASGNSPNLIEAVKYANANNALTFAITAFDGGELKKLASNSLHVKTDHKEYGPAEDIHMIFDHLFSSFINRLINHKDD